MLDTVSSHGDKRCIACCVIFGCKPLGSVHANDVCASSHLVCPHEAYCFSVGWWASVRRSYLEYILGLLQDSLRSKANWLGSLSLLQGLHTYAGTARIRTKLPRFDCHVPVAPSPLPGNCKVCILQQLTVWCMIQSLQDMATSHKQLLAASSTIALAVESSSERKIMCGTTI